MLFDSPGRCRWRLRRYSGNRPPPPQKKTLAGNCAKTRARAHRPTTAPTSSFTATSMKFGQRLRAAVLGSPEAPHVVDYKSLKRVVSQGAFGGDPLPPGLAAPPACLRALAGGCGRAVESGMEGRGRGCASVAGGEMMPGHIPARGALARGGARLAPAGGAPLPPVPASCCCSHLSCSGTDRHGTARDPAAAGRRAGGTSTLN